MTPIFPAPKPKSSPRKARFTRFNSTIAQPSHEELRAAAKKLRAGSTPPKKRNAKRQRSEFARCYHSRERVRFVKALPCPVCIVLGMARCMGESDNAHIIGGGAGRKANYDQIAPLCRLHHRALHAAGSLSAFYVTFGCKVDLAAVAAATEKLWRECALKNVHPPEKH